MNAIGERNVFQALRAELVTRSFSYRSLFWITGIISFFMSAVLDNLGNRIQYTLDNAGKRTAVEVRDPGGLLRRSLSRSIDALGLVQQTTGREVMP